MITEPIRGPKRPTKKCPGFAGGDLNSTGLRSVKDCRLSAAAPATIRSKSNVGLTSGYVHESDAKKVLIPGAINMRHAKRRYAKAMAKRSR